MTAGRAQRTVEKERMLQVKTFGPCCLRRSHRDEERPRIRRRQGLKWHISFLVWLCFVSPVVLGQTLSPSVSPQPSTSVVPSNPPSTSVGPSNLPSTSVVPTNSPSISVVPSNSPSISFAPSNSPSISFAPSNSPSISIVPSNSPSISAAPSNSPSETPTSVQSQSPSRSWNPSNSPSALPSSIPSQLPTQSLSPSLPPSGFPSVSSKPSNAPTASQKPTFITSSPSYSPTSSIAPSHIPTRKPSQLPSERPSVSSEPTPIPSDPPSPTPSEQASGSPTISVAPTFLPSLQPAAQPSHRPSLSNAPSEGPTTVAPTRSTSPTQKPSSPPTASFPPTVTKRPTATPTTSPTKDVSNESATVRMVVQGMERELADTSKGAWQSMTDQFVKEFWNFELRASPIEVESVSTFFLDQRPITDGGIRKLDSRPLQIRYDQTITYVRIRPPEEQPTREQLFGLPFVANQVKYTRQLGGIVNNSRPIFVDAVDIPSPPSASPAASPAAEPAKSPSLRPTRVPSEAPTQTPTRVSDNTSDIPGGGGDNKGRRNMAIGVGVLAICLAAAGGFIFYLMRRDMKRLKQEAEEAVQAKDRNTTGDPGTTETSGRPAFVADGEATSNAYIRTPSYNQGTISTIGLPRDSESQVLPTSREPSVAASRDASSAGTQQPQRALPPPGVPPRRRNSFQAAQRAAPPEVRHERHLSAPAVHVRDPSSSSTAPPVDHVQTVAVMPDAGPLPDDSGSVTSSLLESEDHFPGAAGANHQRASSRGSSTYDPAFRAFELSGFQIEVQDLDGL